LKKRTRTTDLLILLALTATAVLVHGYHYGVEDQSIYLPSIKRALDAELYPHDAQFFLSQTRWTGFDELVVASVRMTGASLETMVFLWHVAGIFLLLLGCLRVARRVFASPEAQWAGVGLVAALLTMPVAGTLVLIADQYMHPRVYATAISLFAMSAVLDGSLLALAWIALGAAIHPQVIVLATGHLLFQAWRAPRGTWPGAMAPRASQAGMLAALPAWDQVMLSRRHHFPLRWTWYEWLGAYGPVLILGAIAVWARRSGERVLEHVSRRLAISCALGTALTVAMNSSPALLRFMPTQPMRHLHFVYVMLALIGGGLLGRYLLKRRPARWALAYAPVCLLMLAVQFQVFRHSRHIEWPGREWKNEWLQAFAWIRQNTPKDALFALNPQHMSLEGEDNHGFRAIAERSMLADAVKDRGVAAIFPAVAEVWLEETRATSRWQDFQRRDFLRLRREFGVSWVVLEPPAGAAGRGGDGLPCPYRNAKISVCKVE
jgi:hypothetical protein